MLWKSLKAKKVVTSLAKMHKTTELMQAPQIGCPRSRWLPGYAATNNHDEMEMEYVN